MSHLDKPLAELNLETTVHENTRSNLQQPRREPPLRLTPQPEFKSALKRNSSQKSIKSVEAPVTVKIREEPKEQETKRDVVNPIDDRAFRDKSAIQEATERIHILIRENDDLMAENRRKSKELEALSEKLKQKTWLANSQENSLEQHREKLEAIRKEVEDLRDEKVTLERQIKVDQDDMAENQVDYDDLKLKYEEKKREAEFGHAKVNELKIALQDVTERYQQELKEASQTHQREKQLMDQLNAKTTTLEEFEIKYYEMQRIFKEKTAETEEVQKTLHALESRVQQQQVKEITYMEQVNALEQQLGEALFERDASLDREKHLKLTIQSLQEQLQQVTKKTSEKTASALELLRTQFNQDRRRFAEETSALETLCAKLQTQAERAIREKRSAESELEKMTRHLPQETDRLTMALEEMHSRLVQSEREKHDAQHKLEQLVQRHQRESNLFEQERQQLYDKSEDAYRRLRRLESEAEDDKQHRMTLINKVSDLEHDLKQQTEQKQKLKSQSEEILNQLNQKHSLQISELTNKLEIVTEAHNRTSYELQQLLSDQRKMSEKCKTRKEDFSQREQHYQQMLQKQKQEVQECRQRVQEMELHHQQLIAQKKDLIEQVTAEKKERAVVHGRYTQAENRIEMLARQVNVLISKETELLETNKRLQKSIDKMQLQRPKVLPKRHIEVPETTQIDMSKLEQELERVKQRTKQRLRDPYPIVEDSD